VQIEHKKQRVQIEHKKQRVQGIDASVVASTNKYLPFFPFTEGTSNPHPIEPNPNDGHLHLLVPKGVVATQPSD